MSYFILKNDVRIISKKQKNTDKIQFNDLKKYMDYVKTNYTIATSDNDVNEIIEIFSQLHLNKNNIFLDIEIDDTINDFFDIDNNNYQTIITDKLNYHLKSRYNLILRIDNLLDYKTVEYMYSLFYLYKELIIYNCYITNINSYRIFVVCNCNNNNLNYQTVHKIPYFFTSCIKNLYYQIIQYRINMIKKQFNQENNIDLWNNMYLNV